MDSSTLPDPRKWTSRQACSGRRPAGPRGQINLLYRWKDHHQTLTKKTWKQQHPNFNQSDSLHKLNRPEQVILFRLRTGHNRLNVPMYSKFKDGESQMCPCNADTWLQNIYYSAASYMMLWGRTCGQHRNHWGTSSMAAWRSWRGQPFSWGWQVSV